MHGLHGKRLGALASTCIPRVGARTHMAVVVHRHATLRAQEVHRHGAAEQHVLSQS